LPPFADFWRELSALFRWLDGVVPQPLAAMRLHGPVSGWRPPATLRVWSSGAIEQIRFAALNQLLVEFDYTDEKGMPSHRRVEPYMLRQTIAGELIVGAFDLGRGAGRTFRIDRIRNVAVTETGFSPRFAIEVSGAMAPAAAPPRQGIRPTHRSAASAATTYVIKCPVCQRTFRRRTTGTALRPHKNAFGSPCSGRLGINLGPA
jgi:hypothetical protein